MQSDDEPGARGPVRPDTEPDTVAAPVGPGGPSPLAASPIVARPDDQGAAASGSGASGVAAGPPDAPRKPRRSLLTELPILVVVALVIAVLIKTFVVQAFWIPTGSMQDTLQINDKVLVNKLVYHFRSIEPGDIVVFNGAGTWNTEPTPAPVSSNPLARLYDDTLRPVFSSIGGLFGTPLGQVDYVKRVIGVPGDHVVCCNAQGLITVNGVPLHEQSYLYPGDKSDSAPPGIPANFNVTVPRGYLWVLGDHRGISDDSRGHEADPGDGMILESKVIGRAFLIVWPPSQWRVLPIPSTFDQPGIDKPARSSAAAPLPASTAADELPAQVRPEPSYLPLTAGLVLAVPLTWLQRRTRRRLRRRRQPGSEAEAPAPPAGA
jgi:signal peptidase I